MAICTISRKSHQTVSLYSKRFVNGIKKIGLGVNLPPPNCNRRVKRQPRTKILEAICTFYIRLICMVQMQYITDFVVCLRAGLKINFPSYTHRLTTCTMQQVSCERTGPLNLHWTKHNLSDKKIKKIQIQLSKQLNLITLNLMRTSITWNALYLLPRQESDLLLNNRFISTRAVHIACSVLARWPEF